MREIKFRAWLKPRWEDDEDAGKMYYDVQDSYDTLGDVKPYDPMDSFDDWLDDEVAIVEQYTGLKDKNGKEIYEGDIVKWSYRIDRHYEKQYDNMVVEWSLGKNEYYPCSTESGFSLPESEDGYEVIGNIHENPELLEEEE